MDFKVELVEPAEDEYHEIVNWYEDQQSGLGLRFYSEMENLFRRLEKNPIHYGYIINPFRQVRLKVFPYRIVFKIQGMQVRIIAIFHISRNEKELYKRLK